MLSGDAICKRIISSLFLTTLISCCEVGMWGNLAQVDSSTTYRPSATTGVITNATSAYDTDAPPWTTYAEKALVTGSAVAGTQDTDTVTYTTFPALSKVSFTTCSLQVVNDT